MSQSELGGLAGMTPNKISKSLRRQRRWQPAELERIESILGIDLTGQRRTPRSPVPRAEAKARIAFGQRLQTERQRGEMTVSEAAEGICEDARWHDFEAGRALPGLIELQLICDRLRDSADWLLRGRERQQRMFDDRPQTVFHEDNIIDNR